MIETSCTDCQASNVQESHETTAATANGRKHKHPPTSATTNRRQAPNSTSNNNNNEQDNGQHKLNKTFRPRINYLPNYLSNQQQQTQQPLLSSPHFFLANFNANGLGRAAGGHLTNGFALNGIGGDVGGGPVGGGAGAVVGGAAGAGGGPGGAGPSTGGGPGSGGGQFVLTPDARACVTATYLCVLIVNNTWLDCNLLEMLCNGSSSGSGGAGGANSNTKNGRAGGGGGGGDGTKNQEDQDDSMLRDAQNATRWLTDTSSRRDEFAALESAISGLIAFAGGTEEDEGGGGAGDHHNHQMHVDQSTKHNYHHNRQNIGLFNQHHHQPVRLAHSEPRPNQGQHIYVGPVNIRPEPDKTDNGHRNPIEPRDEGGGAPGLYHAASRAEDGEQPVSSVVVELPEKMSRLVGEDKEGFLEHYFNFRRDQLRQRPHDQHHLRHMVQLRQMPDDNNQMLVVNDTQDSLSSDSTTTTTTTEQPQQEMSTSDSPLGGHHQVHAGSNPQGSSLISWMGRPFRGWGSYIFWPISGGSSVDLTGQQQHLSKQVDHQIEFLPSAVHLTEASRQTQILRPIDRSEQYNDIATNQTSLKLEAEHGHQQQQQVFANMAQTTTYPEFHTSEQQAGRQQVAPTTSNVVHLAPPMPAANSAASHVPSHIIGLDFNGGRPHRLIAGHNHLAHQQMMDNNQGHQHQHQHQFLPHALQEQPDGGSGMSCKCADMATTMDDYECQLHCGAAAAAGLVAGVGSQPGSTSSSATGSASPTSSTTTTTTTTITPLLVALNSGTTSTSLLSTTPNHDQNIEAQQQQQQQQMATSSSFTTSTSTTIGPNAKMNPLDVSFLLYTRYHQSLLHELAKLNGVQVNGNNHPNSGSDGLLSFSDIIELTNETSLNVFKLNSSLPIKIIIHGFGSGGRRPWVTDMVYKLLDYEDVNVIVVDWEKGATLPNYVQAAGNTRLVGHKIASLIKSINNKYKLTGNNFHLIGFSLGAHVAGFAGMEIRNSTRHLINRITGLDPASPLFEGYEANDRLDPSDAQFVDVIHSNGDGVLRGGFGSLQPMGHVDFYPNGGRVQVGCNSVLLSALSDIIYGKWQSLCNHRRALNFFMDSFEFNKCRFKSFNCDSYDSYLRGECFDCGQNNERCSYMGYRANHSKGRGKMYLTTHEEAPFCANQFLVKIVGSRGYKSHLGKVEVTLVTADGRNESFVLSSINDRPSSSSYELTASGQKELMGQHSMQSLIVAYPSLANYTHILLRYTKYKGWIYSGDESWPIDKVFITDSDGQVKSYCGANTILESHVTTRVHLEPGNCTVDESKQHQHQQAQVIAGGRALGAPTQSLMLGPTGPNQQQQLQQDAQQQQQQLQTPQQPQPPSEHQNQSHQQQQQQQQQSTSPIPSSSRGPRLFASMIQSMNANDGPDLPAGSITFQRVGIGGPLQGFALSNAAMARSISHQPVAAY